MARTYKSFAGVDINAVFNDVVFGELQMVSYKSDREKGPVYTMGSADPRAFARGKRLITGACVFVVFDKDTLLNEIGAGEDVRPWINKDELANFTRGKGYKNTASRDAHRAGGSISDLDGTTINTQSASAAQTALKSREQPLTHDQILPFDITLVAANEYGNVSKMIIHGVELMTAAGGMSIDDLVIEKQISFLAHRITDWHNT